MKIQPADISAIRDKAARVSRLKRPKATINQPMNGLDYHTLDNPQNPSGDRIPLRDADIPSSGACWLDVEIADSRDEPIDWLKVHFTDGALTSIE